MKISTRNMKTKSHLSLVEPKTFMMESTPSKITFMQALGAVFVKLMVSVLPKRDNSLMVYKTPRNLILVKK